MPDKISLGVRTDKLETEYTGEKINSVESFDTNKSIDNQLNKLNDREDAKSSIQSELDSIKSTKDFKKFLVESEHDEGLNKYVTTYANHISIKLGDHEYVFEAEDERTRVAIHTAIVEFFRTQVIEAKKKEYKNSQEYATATDAEKKAKKEEIEAEFAKDKFEIDTDALKTSMTTEAEATDETKTEEEPKKEKLFQKIWRKFKEKLKSIGDSGNWGNMLGLSALAASIGKTQLGSRIGLVDEDLGSFVEKAGKDADKIAELQIAKQTEYNANATENEPVV